MSIYFSTIFFALFVTSIFSATASSQCSGKLSANYIAAATVPSKQTKFLVSRSGYIEYVAKNGAFIESGRPLLILDTSQLLNELEQLKVVLSEHEYDIETVNLKRDMFEIELNKAKYLLESGAIEQYQLHKLELQIKQISSSLEKAKLKKKKTILKIESKEQDIQYSKIVAPFDGVFHRPFFQDSNYVFEGSDLGKFQSEDLKLRVFVEKKYLREWPLGKTFYFQNNQCYELRVSYASDFAEQASGLILIELEFISNINRDVLEPIVNFDLFH